MRTLEKRLEALERLEQARAAEGPPITEVIVWLPGVDPATLRTGTVFVRGRVVPYSERIPPPCPEGAADGERERNIP